MVAESAHAGHHRLGRHRTGGFRGVSKLSVMRASYQKGEYESALAVAAELIENEHLSPVCGVVYVDVPRLALHCRHFSHAIKYAGLRLPFAKWEPTTHANLLLAFLAKGSLRKAVEHLVIADRGSPCEICQKYSGVAEEGTSPSVNEPLAAAVAMCVMAHSSSPDLLEWSEGVMSQVVPKKAPTQAYLARSVASKIVGALASDRRVASPPATRELTDLVWELIPGSPTNPGERRTPFGGSSSRLPVRSLVLGILPIKAVPNACQHSLEKPCQPQPCIRLKPAWLLSGPPILGIQPDRPRHAAQTPVTVKWSSLARKPNSRSSRSRSWAS